MGPKRTPILAGRLSRHKAPYTRIWALLFVTLICLPILGCTTDEAATQATVTQVATNGYAKALDESASYERAGTYRSMSEGRAVDVSEEEATLVPVGDPQAATTRYTLMVYMIGSNLESMNAAATDDLEEMVSSGIDFAQVNVVVCAGGARRWNSDLPNDRNSVIDLSLPVGERIVAQSASKASMGAPETLASFLDFCAKHYPADHMALVFWDHGGGPLWGYGLDETSDGDGLTLAELHDAMSASAFSKEEGLPLDWVGFDACLMGSMENAALWSKYTGWLVASEEVEPGDGWNYGFLSRLSSETDPRSISQPLPA